MAEENFKTVASNKKAYHDYFVEEKFEAGIELTGTEVKSIRQGHVSLKESWCEITHGELSSAGCTSALTKRATSSTETLYACAAY